MVNIIPDKICVGRTNKAGGSVSLPPALMIIIEYIVVNEFTRLCFIVSSNFISIVPINH